MIPCLSAPLQFHYDDSVKAIDRKLFIVLFLSIKLSLMAAVVTKETDHILGNNYWKASFN